MCRTDLLSPSQTVRITFSFEGIIAERLVETYEDKMEFILLAPKSGYHIESLSYITYNL